MIHLWIGLIWLGLFAVQPTGSGFQSKRLSRYNTMIQWSSMTGVTVSKKERKGGFWVSVFEYFDPDPIITGTKFCEVCSLSISTFKLIVTKQLQRAPELYPSPLSVCSLSHSCTLIPFRGLESHAFDSETLKPASRLSTHSYM